MLSLFIQENMTVALGFTLLDSLWEGVVLAFLTGMIMVFTRRSRAAVRYNLLVGALALFFLAVSFTFLYEMGRHTVPPGNWPGSRVGSWIDGRIGSWIRDHAGMVAAVWLAVISLKLIKLSFDLFTLQRLKVVRARPLEADLQRRVNGLASGLGIQRVIRVLESAVVRAPLVIGYIRPVVLIPAGMIARLAPEDLEVILLHELAHICRADYLVNIFLRIISILLFFNPAALWVSYLIRAERENCCDDMVIRHTGNKINYIRALVHFEEQRASSFAMAFGGSVGILPRVQRLAAGYSRTLNKTELFILSLLLVLTCFFVGLHADISARASPAMEAKLKAEAAAAGRQQPSGPYP